MLKKRVIPCLLLKNNGLVKTVRFENPKYVGDPINAIKIFNEKEADELIFLDITATPENRKPQMKLLSEIASECFMPLAYGGGIRTLEEIKEIFNLGIEKVVINSYAAENPLFIKQAAEIFGSQSIVAAIDVKKNVSGRYEIFTYGGRRATNLEPVQFAKRMEEMGAGELFLNSIDKDGTMSGCDIELIRTVSGAINIPVIACGGMGKLGDLKNAIESGASAVAAGSMFVFYGSHRAVLISYLTPQEMNSI